MKRQLTCGLTLALIYGGAQAESQHPAATLDSLEAITSQTDEAPALLYLTPSQVAAATPTQQSRLKKKKTSSTTVALAENTAALNELKAQQAVLNQMIAKVARQAEELTTLRQQLAQAGQQNTEQQTLESRLRQAQQQTVALQQRLDTQGATLHASETEKDALQQTLAANQTERAALQAQLLALKATLADKDRVVAELGQEKQARKPLISVPDNPNGLRDYAIGTELGGDVMALLDTRAHEEGILLDKTVVLAGMEDAFAGQYRLPADKVNLALKALESKQLEQATQLKTQNELKGTKYVAQFRKQPRTKKAAMGYDYRIDYQGEGVIHASDSVTIVVKESLVDGTVVKDMEAAKTSVSQPLSAYPPLFKSALGQLQNHGSMTLVVPPLLAYGNKGLPPSIPPGATMIYTVRILDVIPADTLSAEEKK
ncbi:TPA: FKBP-type peptidyl-prolyl cis-trans isomerase N-terminal domain-containing protein [Serratia fonticola]